MLSLKTSIAYSLVTTSLWWLASPLSAQEDRQSRTSSTQKNSPIPPDPATPPNPNEEWSYLANGKIKVGIKRSSGAAIGWLSLAESDQNLVNHFDRGRLIQQSYYGDADGSMWAKQPWNWNPVQGGHYLGSGAPVTELQITEQKIYAKSTPLHWATGEQLTDCTMEQTITLDEFVAHVRYRFTYSGQREHSIRDQEVPAVFLEPQYKHLVLYSGEQPWRAGQLDNQLDRTIPGWPNERREITENWAAYVDDNDFGLGAYVPVAEQLTCYRFGNGRREQGACSYFAPIVRFAIKPGLTWEYDLYLTVGTQADIRARFQAIQKSQKNSN